MNRIDLKAFKLRLLVSALLVGACTPASQARRSTAVSPPTQLAQPTSDVDTTDGNIPGPVSSDSVKSTSAAPSTTASILGLMYEGEILGEPAAIVTTTSALPETPYKITLNTLTPIDSRNPNRFLAITAAALGDCHICQVRIDAAVVESEGSVWRLESVGKGLATMGSMGQIQPGSPVAIGPNMLAVIVRGAYASQGQYEQDTAIIGIIKGQVGVLFLLRDTELYDATVVFEDCRNRTQVPTCQWGYTTNLEFVPGSNPEVFDLRVTQTGTNQDGVAIDNTRILTLSEDGYWERR